MTAYDYAYEVTDCGTRLLDFLHNLLVCVVASMYLQYVCTIAIFADGTAVIVFHHDTLEKGSEHDIINARNVHIK